MVDEMPIRLFGAQRSAVKLEMRPAVLPIGHGAIRPLRAAERQHGSLTVGYQDVALPNYWTSVQGASLIVDVMQRWPGQHFSTNPSLYPPGPGRAPGAYQPECDAGWAVATISHPQVGTTDGDVLFRAAGDNLIYKAAVGGLAR